MENINLGYNFGKVFNNTTNLRVGANVQNAFVIDGRGEPGINGTPMGDWYTSPSNGYDGPWGHVGHDAHAQYEAGIHDRVTGGYKGNDGSNGGNGAVILIQYKIVDNCEEVMRP